MLSRNLKQKKRNTAVLFFILVYSLLLGQEVLLNRVLCVKSGSAIKLESTFLNYHCPCEDNGLSPTQREGFYSLNVDDRCSLHIPLEDTYLARILSPGQKIFNSVYITEIYIKTTGDFGKYIYQGHHLLPYIRYLQIFLELNQYFILLC